MVMLIPLVEARAVPSLNVVPWCTGFLFTTTRLLGGEWS